VAGRQARDGLVINTQGRSDATDRCRLHWEISCDTLQFIECIFVQDQNLVCCIIGKTRSKRVPARGTEESVYQHEAPRSVCTGTVHRGQCVPARGTEVSLYRHGAPRLVFTVTGYRCQCVPARGTEVSIRISSRRKLQETAEHYLSKSLVFRYSPIIINVIRFKQDGTGKEIDLSDSAEIQTGFILEKVKERDCTGAREHKF
jgi:hypothetical protein